MNECILIQLYYMCLTSSYTHLGEVNAGKMHWGLKQSNDERHHVPTVLLSILAGSECMSTYRGTHKNSFESCMKSFNREVFDHFGPSHPPLMTQELYGPHSTHNTTDSNPRTVRKRCRKKSRVEGAKRRRLHQELVSDQCSVGDGIDLRRSVRDIMSVVQTASPDGLDRIERKEREGKARPSLIKMINGRRRTIFSQNV